MSKLLSVAKNTCLQTMRQPVFGIIVLVTLGGFALMPSLTGWTLDDDNKMLRDIGLSTLLVQGLFLVCFAASTTLDAEIEEKTLLTSAVKPINRAVFLTGKYLGVIGAAAAAHYLATIAYFMTMRHGVLQTATDHSDPTVLAMGPGLLLVGIAASLLLNFIYDWRFLPTVVAFAIPLGTLGGAVLLLVDRTWHAQSWETTQTMDGLPAQVDDPGKLKGIVDFRPLAGDSMLTGHRGYLVRKNWKGPINDIDRGYLLEISDSLGWKRDVDYLVAATRKLEGAEAFKAAILIFVAFLILGAVAVAASTRVGMMATFLVCFLVLGVGLASDYVIRPHVDPGLLPGFLQSFGGLPSNVHPGEGANEVATALYPLLPNFQFFWVIDAMSDERVIPWEYVREAVGYALLYAAGVLFLGMALFETREVG